MNVLVTGSSKGIGKAIAQRFLDLGHEVFGLDLLAADESMAGNAHYHHFVADVRERERLPELPRIDILVSNAGMQNSPDDIDANLRSAIFVTEKYMNAQMRSILFIASASAHTGAEFPLYAAAKGGLVTYMRNVALRMARHGVLVNSLSPGGVLTELNAPVMRDEALWARIMEVTPLKRWATPEEIADWVEMFTLRNRFCTGQDLLIDGGEKDLNSQFVWPV